MRTSCNLIQVADVYSEGLLTGLKGTKVPDNICFQNSKGREKLKGKKNKAV